MENESMENSRGPIVKRVFWKDGTFKDCDEGAAWEYSGDPTYDRSESLDDFRKCCDEFGAKFENNTESKEQLSDYAYSLPITHHTYMYRQKEIDGIKL